MRAALRLSAEMRDLRERLSSRDDVVREQACLDAQRLPAETLLGFACEEARQARKRSKLQEVFAGFGCLWFLLLLVTLAAQLMYGIVFPVWACLLVLWLPVMIAVITRLGSDRHICYSLSRALNAQADARFVAPALLFYHEIDSRVDEQLYKDVRQTLLRLLPQVTAANVETWTVGQKAALCDHITSYHDREMTHCVLQTLERVGDGESMRAVRILANTPLEELYKDIHAQVYAKDRKVLFDAIVESPTARTGRMSMDERVEPQAGAVMRDPRYQEWCRERAQELHQAAERCLTAIMERAASQRQADVLLRAANTTDLHSAQILLRPVESVASATPPEQLLRPGEK